MKKIKYFRKSRSEHGQNLTMNGLYAPFRSRMEDAVVVVRRPFLSVERCPQVTIFESTYKDMRDTGRSLTEAAGEEWRH